jgi:hypothetical protein
MTTTLSGGINTSTNRNQIDNSEHFYSYNLREFKDVLKVETGYGPFGSPVLGVPQNSAQLQLVSGASILLLATTATIYQWDAGVLDWFICPTAATTLTAPAAANATSIVVASSTGFIGGYAISINLNNNQWHTCLITGVAGTTVNISPGLPSAAASGNVVNLGVALNGNVNLPTRWVPWPAQGYLVFSNAVDPVMYFNGSVLAPVPGLPTNTTCFAMVVFHEQLFLLNTVENGVAYPYQIRVSDQGDITNWSTGLAATYPQPDTDDFIYDALILAGWLIIYRSRSIMRCTYLGILDQTYFFEYMITEEGAMGYQTTVDIGGKHIFAGNSNIYLYEGGYDYTPLGDDVQYTIYPVTGSMDVGLAYANLAVYDKYQDIYFLFIRTNGAGALNVGFKLDIGDNVWTIRVLNDQIAGSGSYLRISGVTWAEAQGTWAQNTYAWNANVYASAASLLLFSDISGQVLAYDYVSTTDNGVTIPWLLQTKDFGNDRIKNRLNRVLISGVGEVTIGVALDHAGTYMDLGTFSLDGGTGNTTIFQLTNQFVYNYIAFQFSGTDPTFLLEFLTLEYLPESLW